jgi:hypothetical protein
MKANMHGHSAAQLRAEREVAFLAEIDALIGDGVSTPVDAEWVTTEALAPGIDVGFMIKAGRCTKMSHSSSWIETDRGYLCERRHRRVARPDDGT